MYSNDRERSSFINPWASNQTPASSFGGAQSGYNSNGFNGNFGGNNQFGNNGLGLGNFGNQNPNLGNSLGNGIGSNINNGFGNNPNAVNNNGFDNNMNSGNNGPVFGLNNLGGNNNLGSNNSSNGQNDEGRETTQVTIPKDVCCKFALTCLYRLKIRKYRMLKIVNFDFLFDSWLVQSSVRLELAFAEFAWNRMHSLQSMNQHKDQVIASLPYLVRRVKFSSHNICCSKGEENSKIQNFVFQLFNLINFGG